MSTFLVLLVVVPGNPGKPSFHAELADPYAEPNKVYFPAVDVCFRNVTEALFEGIDHDSSCAQKDHAGMSGNNKLRENWEAYPDDDDPSLTYYWNYAYETGEVTWTPPMQQLHACLTYVTNRIGAQRGKSAAAAMYLKAYLNWAIHLLK